MYVELRAHLGDDWKSKVKLEKAEFPHKEDKALIHMPTPEEEPLSYVELQCPPRRMAELQGHDQERRRRMARIRIGTATPDNAAHSRHAVLDFRGLTDPRVGVTHRVGRSLRERRRPSATVDNALFDAIRYSVKT